MDWSTVVPTLVGGVLAVAGGLSGQVFASWRQDRREAEKARRDEAAERERWARERRYEVYQRFLDLHRDKFDALYDNKLEHPDREPPEDYLGPLYDLLIPMRLLCAATVNERAEYAFRQMSEYAFGSGSSRDVSQSRELLVDAFREELQLPPVYPPH